MLKSNHRRCLHLGVEQVEDFVVEEDNTQLFHVVQTIERYMAIGCAAGQKIITNQKTSD